MNDPMALVIGAQLPWIETWVCTGLWPLPLEEESTLVPIQLLGTRIFLQL